MAEAYRYRAFISYSHADDGWGRWLHRALESYRVPRRLVGRTTTCGPVPSRLTPVFRDRDELPSSAELGTLINEALAASRHQIVICSPHAAASRWVNEEIKHFKSLGREDRVLALIIAGEPGASENPRGGQPECFPPALRFRVDADGGLTAIRSEPIAADARAGKDGRRDALLKLVSGLIGVGLDELKQRERQRARWRAIGWAALALAVVAMLGGVWQWQEQQRRNEARQALIARYTEIGRQELMAEHRARAAVYLSAAYSRGADSVPLRFMLAQAMQLVDAQKQFYRAEGSEVAVTASFSPDQQRVVGLEGGYEQATGRVHLWDRASARPVWRDARPESVIAPRFTPDSRRLFVARMQDEQQAALGWIWELLDADSGRSLQRLSGRGAVHDWLDFQSLPPSMAPSAARLALPAEDGGIWYWNLDGQTLPQAVRGQAAVTTVAWLPDSRRLLLGEQDGSIEQWPVTGGKPRRLVTGATGAAPVSALAVAPGADLLAVGDRLGGLRLLDLPGGRERYRLGNHSDSVVALRFSADGRRLLSQGRNGSDLKVWDVAQGTLRLTRPIPGMGGSNFPSALSPDGSRALVQNGNTVELWDVGSNQLQLGLDAFKGASFSAEFSADGSQLLVAGKHPAALLWDARQRPLARFELSRGNRALALSGDGRRVASRVDEHLSLWDADGGQRLGDWQVPKGGVLALAFSPDSRWLIAGDDSGGIVLRDLQAPGGERRLSAGSAAIRRFAFSRDGQQMLSVAGDEIQLWDFATGVLRQRLRGHSATVRCAQFSPDGQRVVSGAEDKTARVWDLATGRQLLLLGGHGWNVVDASFSPDGQRIATASWDSTLRLWDAASGKPLQQLRSPDDGAYFRLRFDRSGRRLLAGEEFNVAKIWDPERNRVLSLRGSGGVFMIDWLADDRLVLTGSADGQTRVWDADSGQPLANAANQAGSAPFVHLDTERRRLLTSSAADDSARLWDLRLEDRRPAEIEALLRCRVPWALDGDELVPRVPDSAGCDAPAQP